MSPTSNAIETRFVSISLLRPSKRPLRNHNRHQRRKIAKLCRLAGGQPIPIISNAAFEIIDGHAIYEHLKDTGATEALVTVLHSASQVDARALRILINRIAEDSRWNFPNLKLEMLDLIKDGYDLVDTGFEPAELDRILRLDIPEHAVGEGLDHLPPLEECAVARLGDIFQLGDTGRCGCGDARDKAFIERVCEGAFADVCIVDPLKRKKSSARKNRPSAGPQRNQHAHDEIFALLHDCLDVLKRSSAPHALIYTFVDWRYVLEVTAAGRQLDLPLINIATWIKSYAASGSPYRNQHELCAVFKAGDEPLRINKDLRRVGRTRSNVWNYSDTGSLETSRGELLRSHAPCKPVVMLADIIRDATRPGDIVLDTFAGYGSTMIAAEEVGRRFCASDANPLYVDLAIRRWQQTTGRDAIHVATGLTFGEYASRQGPRQLTGRRA